MADLRVCVQWIDGTGRPSQWYELAWPAGVELPRRGDSLRAWAALPLAGRIGEVVAREWQPTGRVGEAPTLLLTCDLGAYSGDVLAERDSGGTCGQVVQDVGRAWICNMPRGHEGVHNRGFAAEALELAEALIRWARKDIADDRG